ncbi:hypothetical protein C4577_00380 [Candidatus Parcubacteria bacterium]|nr:MAG: hypothetical protein C4577_00380 [Candidatus Parcubacteria bacterium]
MKKFKRVLLIILLLVIGLIVIWYFSNNNPQRNLSKIIPNGSYLREVKDIPDIKDIKIIVYIEQPIIEKEFNLANTTSCSGSTLGQSIEGVYHLALLKNNALYSDIIIPSYINEGNQENNKQQLAFKNTKAMAYYYFSGDKFNERERNSPVDVSLIQFGEFNTQKSLVDFVITGPQEVCGHTSYLHGGYDTQSDKLILYPIVNGDKKYFWGDNFSPSKYGEVINGWTCGDHGADTDESNYYKFEATASAYMFYKSDIKECR